MCAGAVASVVSLGVLVTIVATNPWFLDAPLLWLLGVHTPFVALAGLSGAVVGGRRTVSPELTAGVIALLVTSTAAVPLCAWAPKPGADLELLVVGVDGATFDVIDTMPADQVRTFRAMQAAGVRADLMSIEPMFSPLLWSTIATGKPPGVHGVHGFRVQASDVSAARFWDVMRQHGRSVGTWKWLVTYPPDASLAFQVPAWLAPAPETHPPGLDVVKQLELSQRVSRKTVAATQSMPTLALRAIGRGLRLSTLAAAGRVWLQERLGRSNPDQRYYDGQLLRTRIDRDLFVAELTASRPDVATFTTYATDGIAHRFWKYYEPERFEDVAPEDVARWGSALPDAYAQADEVLAELMAVAGPRARVVVISDHGSRALVQRGGHLLAPKTERLRTRMLESVDGVDVTRLGHKLVVAVPDEARREQAETWLDGFLRDRTGEPFYRYEPIPSDPLSLGLTVRDENAVADNLADETVGGEPARAFVSLATQNSGDHDIRGVFLALGPGIAAGARLPVLTLYDVAPILLSMTGIPPALDMRGRVPAGLFVEPPDLAGAPETWDAALDGRALIGGADGVEEEQLRALGYIE